MEKDYRFTITILLNLNALAESEEEARGKLTEHVADYFIDTTTTISKNEAKLTDIFDMNGNRITE